MEALNSNVINPLREFAKDSVRLYNKCSKPTKKEFIATAQATAIGFAIMGAIGFLVKLVHIPVNGILVGGPLTA